MLGDIIVSTNNQCGIVMMGTRKAHYDQPTVDNKVYQYTLI